MTRTLTTERQQFEAWFNEEMVMPVTESNSTAVRLMWKAWRASRELLANREAKPVGVMNIGSETCSDYRVAWTTAGAQLGKGVHWLYTAPPAPAVPEWEAQPVMYASEETLAYAKEGEKSLVTWSEPMGDAVIPLFTLATAQASGVVNLPTEFISDEGVVVRLEQVMAALALVGVKYERRGDACRAAMLAAAPEGGNG